MYSSLEIKSKFHNYSVIFQDNLILEDKSFKIIDKNVAKHYPYLVDDNSLVIQTNEYLKSWDSLKSILDWFVYKNVNLQSHIFIIGGGILQDAVGFCASIYARGINYTLVPTTLLSQIDSCIGGKTSINFNNKKNILGTFYPPKKILIYSKFLNTISEQDYCSGLGELFKFDILQNKLNVSKIINLIDNKNNINQEIYDSLKYKISILEIDELDKKERKFLNFGHTLGHALEITSNYELSHGFAVSIGCMFALNISSVLCNEYKDLTYAENILKRLLAKTVKLKKEWFNYSNILECMKSDKKNTNDLNMVLICNGKPVIQKIEDYTIIKEELDNIYETFGLYN